MSIKRMRTAKDKPPKSAGKCVQWGIRHIGNTILASAPYIQKSEAIKLKLLWDETYIQNNYELVRITIEPVTISPAKKKVK